MNILVKIILLFTVIPLVELFLLIKISQWTSFMFTLLLVITTGVIGGILAKQQGISVWEKLSRTMGRGMMPTDEIIEGILILIAGALLITPGIITDITGFLILIPFTRGMIRNVLKKWIKRWIDRGDVHISFFRPQ